MFKKIIEKINFIKYLLKENAQLSTRILDLESQRKDPRMLVAEILGTNPEWYDYEKLPKEELKKYYNAAQECLNNIAVINERNRLFREWSDWTLRQAPDYQGVRDMRMQYSGIKLLLDRLEDIPDPDKPKEGKKTLEETLKDRYLSI